MSNMEMTSTTNADGKALAATSSSFDASRYAWFDDNRTRGFDTWEAEIAHMESLGFKLVPPDYKIPHWSEAFSGGEAIPKIYVSIPDGAREMNTAFNRYAAEIGYPLFFKQNNDAPKTQPFPSDGVRN